LLSLFALLLIPVAVSRQGRNDGLSAPRPGTQVTGPVVRDERTRAALTPASLVVLQSTVARTATAVMTEAATSTARLPVITDPNQLAGTIAAVTNGDLRLFSATGTSRLTQSGIATAPRWSPSGRWLLYETPGTRSSAQLWLLQPDAGTAAWRLPSPADSGLARWSPGRDEIAVASPGGSLWLVQAGSDTLRSLLPPGGLITNLAWSPDGSELAVERRGVGGETQSLWLVSRGGSITQVPGARLDAPLATTGAVGQPVDQAAQDTAALPVLGTWSPSSDRFTFWLTRDLKQGAATPAPLALWTRNQSARGLLPAVLMYRDFISWAPDGHALAAVASVLAAGGRQQFGQITVVPVRPQGPAQQLSDAGRADGDAAWSPDGALIAYASSLIPPPDTRSGSSRRIWLEAPDGSGRRPLSAGPLDTFPQWSKDGQEILYVHQTADTAQLWLVGRDGSDPHPVVDGIVGMQQLPGRNFGNSGLASYRGVFDWSAAAGD
ncbi:MAG TPA: hypothetical protein VIU62_07550, partial [Chloroflexota bacterium]